MRSCTGTSNGASVPSKAVENWAASAESYEAGVHSAKALNNGAAIAILRYMRKSSTDLPGG
jgi:hypothetical protein